jgi:hypothetical protein
VASSHKLYLYIAESIEPRAPAILALKLMIYGYFPVHKL